MKKTIFLPVLLLVSGMLSGYGYGVEDPLIVGFKALAAKLSRQDWPGVSAEIAKLQPQMSRAWLFEGWASADNFKQAVADKDRKTLASEWIRLTVSTSRSDIWWSLHENISDRAKAKARVDAVDRYLKDILGPQIKAKDADLYLSLSGVIGDMRESLGNPGAFGLGAVKKDEARFLRLSCEFDRQIWQAYPHCRPDAVVLGGDPAETARMALKDFNEAEGFGARRRAITNLSHALERLNPEGWAKDVLALYRLMGTPAHGDEAGTGPDPKAQDVSNELKQKIKK